MALYGRAGRFTRRPRLQPSPPADGVPPPARGGGELRRRAGASPRLTAPAPASTPLRPAARRRRARTDARRLRSSSAGRGWTSAVGAGLDHRGQGLPRPRAVAGQPRRARAAYSVSVSLGPTAPARPSPRPRSMRRAAARPRCAAGGGAAHDGVTTDGQARTSAIGIHGSRRSAPATRAAAWTPATGWPGGPRRWGRSSASRSPGNHTCTQAWASLACDVVEVGDGVVGPGHVPDRLAGRDADGAQHHRQRGGDLLAEPGAVAEEELVDGVLPRGQRRDVGGVVGVGADPGDQALRPCRRCRAAPAVTDSGQGLDPRVGVGELGVARRDGRAGVAAGRRRVRAAAPAWACRRRTPPCRWRPGPRPMGETMASWLGDEEVVGGEPHLVRGVGVEHQVGRAAARRRTSAGRSGAVGPGVGRRAG